MRTFKVYRPEPPDEYKRDGITNAGEKPDIEGVVFSDGTCVIRWMVKGAQSHAVWDSFHTFRKVHGHPEYGTRILFDDGLAWPQPVPPLQEWASREWVE